MTNYRAHSWGHLGGMLALGFLVAVATGFLALPVLALLLRVPFSDFASYITRPIVLDVC